MDGAFMFCADLTRRLPMPVRVALAPMPSVTRGGDPSRLALPEDFPVKDADLLVVEDILDTGKTLQALTQHLQGLGPRRLRTAVLLDKPTRREVDFQPQYVGFTVPDRWVVGYGLDSDGLYRNLPYVTYMAE
jgi:hypoxanthine phosphoribosyltransferase